LEVSEGRDINSCRRLISSALSEEQIAGVRTVSMDMWKPYMNMAAERFPKAEVVHDKFHLIKYLTEAIDKVRRREVSKHEELKNTRYALLKNEMNLTEKQRIKFESIKDGNYEVCKAWGVRENFKFLFAENTKQDAFILFSQWCSHSIRTKVKEIDKLVATFQNHVSGVINAMVKTLNNAMDERLNGKIQELKTVGKGYGKFENFRSAIIFFHGHLNLYPQYSW
jgi:transposase